MVNVEFINLNLGAGYEEYKNQIFDAVYLIFEYYITQLITLKIVSVSYKEKNATQIMPFSPQKLKYTLSPLIINSKAFRFIVKRAGKIYSLEKQEDIMVLVVEHVLENRWDDINNKFLRSRPDCPKLP
ncbi:hypothetical protein ACFLSX_03090 [Calditrichota bacterium]